MVTGLKPFTYLVNCFRAKVDENLTQIFSDNYASEYCSKKTICYTFQHANLILEYTVTIVVAKELLLNYWLERKTKDKKLA